MDLPPVEHVCPIEQPAKISNFQDDMEMLHTLNYLILKLERTDAFAQGEVTIHDVHVYLNHLKHKIAQKYKLEEDPSLNEKGYWHDHDREIRHYARDNEFASRDQDYYRRYDMYDSPSYPCK